MVGPAEHNSLPHAAIADDLPVRDGCAEWSSTRARPQIGLGYRSIDLSPLNLTPAELAAEYRFWIATRTR